MITYCSRCAVKATLRLNHTGEIEPCEYCGAPVITPSEDELGTYYRIPDEIIERLLQIIDAARLACTSADALSGYLKHALELIGETKE